MKPKLIGRTRGKRVIRFGSEDTRKYWLEIRRGYVFAVYRGGVAPVLHLTRSGVQAYIKQGVWAYRKP